MGPLSSRDFVTPLHKQGVFTETGLRQWVQNTLQAFPADFLSFRHLYTWAFDYTVEGKRRTIDAETASYLWSVLMPAMPRRMPRRKQAGTDGWGLCEVGRVLLP